MSPEDYFASGKHSYMSTRGEPFAERVYELSVHERCRQYTTAVELGAGTGRFSGPLVRRFERVFLVEPATEYARELEVHFPQEHVSVVADTAEAFLGNCPAAGPVLLCCFHLLHHLDRDQRARIYGFLCSTGSRGIFVDPNPWNPLIPIQIMVTPDMSFSEERRYLKLTPSFLRREFAQFGLEVVRFKRILAVPPFLADRFLRKGLQSLVTAAEVVARLPFMASYQVFEVEPLQRNVKGG